MFTVEASCREDFDSSYVLAPLQISSELPERKRVIVLVHGYNTKYTEARRAYETLQELLLAACTGRKPEIVPFYWPGSRVKLGFAFAVNRATAAGRALAVLIEHLQKRGNVVSIETHSLGARVALTALRFIKNPIKTLVMTAPAVDYDVFSGPCPETGKPAGEFFDVVGKANRMIVLYSRKDWVLRYAYWFSEQFLERTNFKKALGLVGPGAIPEAFEVHDVTELAPGHNKYKKREIIELFARLV